MSDRSRVAVRVAPDALRHVRRGHPWVFDGSVVSVRPEGATGDLAVIFDEDRSFAAIGLYDPDSPLRVRVLHHGAPTPIDGGFWRDRLRDALERRRVLIERADTDAYRWVHGENDGLPGLVVDRYGSTLVVKLDTAAWFAHLDDVVDALVEVASPERVVLRLARSVHPEPGDPGDGEVLRGPPLGGAVPFTERGLRFVADVAEGPKTGWFLDQRDNRARVRRRAEGARVLDVFCSTGGFGVSAAAGGADLVHGVDLSAPALAAAQRNFDRNQHLPAVRAARRQFSHGDAFEVMGALVADRRRFDLVVVDPPSFASRARQVPDALRAYRRLATLALQLVEPGGQLVQSSCSSRVDATMLQGAVSEAADDVGVALDGAIMTGHGADHPVGFAEGAYLDTLYATVTRP